MLAFLKQKATAFAKKYSRIFALFGDPRLYLLSVPVWYMYEQDAPMAKTLIFSLSAFFMIAMILHVLRVILFPALKLDVLMKKSEEDPVAAAHLFQSVILLLIAFLLGLVFWARA